jgi:hypothetical protein
MNLTAIPECFTCNGKQLTTPEKNLLAKLQIKYGFDVTASQSDANTRVNRVTGITSGPLNPLVAALVDFIYECYDNYERNNYQMTYNGKDVPVSLFDRAKYLILKLDSQAYGDLID